MSPWLKTIGVLGFLVAAAAASLSVCTPSTKIAIPAPKWSVMYQERYELAAERICACRDRACADQEVADFARWTEDKKRTYDIQQPPNPTQQQYDELSRASSRYAQCLDRVTINAAAPQR